MGEYSFFSAILGLSSNWRIINVTMDKQSGNFELHLRSQKGNKFNCPTCGALKLQSGFSKVRWLHENSLNIQFYISALIPVITCECCGEIKVDIPWEQHGAQCVEHEKRPSQNAVASEPFKKI